MGPIHSGIHPHQDPSIWDPLTPKFIHVESTYTRIHPHGIHLCRIPTEKTTPSLGSDPNGSKALLFPSSFFEDKPQTNPAPALHSPQGIPQPPALQPQDSLGSLSFLPQIPVWEFQQCASTWHCCRKELNLPGCACHPTASALPAWGTKLLIQLEVNVSFYSKSYPHTVIVYSNRVHNTLILKSTTF